MEGGTESSGPRGEGEESRDVLRFCAEIHFKSLIDGTTEKEAVSLVEYGVPKHFA